MRKSLWRNPQELYSSVCNKSGIYAMAMRVYTSIVLRLLIGNLKYRYNICLFARSIWTLHMIYKGPCNQFDVAWMMRHAGVLHELCMHKPWVTYTLRNMAHTKYHFTLVSYSIQIGICVVATSWFNASWQCHPRNNTHVHQKRSALVFIYRCFIFAQCRTCV